MFVWKVVKYVKFNVIVVVNNEWMLGVGEG